MFILYSNICGNFPQVIHFITLQVTSVHLIFYSYNGRATVIAFGDSKKGQRARGITLKTEGTWLCGDEMFVKQV